MRKPHATLMTKMRVGSPSASVKSSGYMSMTCLVSCACTPPVLLSLNFDLTNATHCIPSLLPISTFATLNDKSVLAELALRFSRPF